MVATVQPMRMPKLTTAMMIMAAVTMMMTMEMMTMNHLRLI